MERWLRAVDRVVYETGSQFSIHERGDFGYLHLGFNQASGNNDSVGQNFSSEASFFVSAVRFLTQSTHPDAISCQGS